MALGLSVAFVVDDDARVEADRLVPFVRAGDPRTDGTCVPSRWLVNVWTRDACLVRLDEYPLTRKHLEFYAAELRRRTWVKRPDEWYRTIDRLRPERVSAPKILVAGMAGSARIALSEGGVQPSNSLYALTSSEWPLRALFTLLRSGVPDVFASVFAPTFSGGTKSFDGNLLGQVRLPRWRDVCPRARRAMDAVDTVSAVPRPDVIALVYGLGREHRGLLEKAPLSPSVTPREILAAA